MSIGKGVILSTSKVVRQRMKFWDVLSEGLGWSVKLDAREPSGHGITHRTRAFK